MTAKELAAKLGLSAAAVSMALNDKPGVSEETRQMVKKAAQKFDVKRPGHSEIRKTGELGKVALIVYKKSGAVIGDTPFFSAVIEGISSTCRMYRHSLNIVFFYEQENPDRQLREIARSSFDGIILLATEMKVEDIMMFSSFSCPIVVLDSCYLQLPFNCVAINNSQGAFSAVNYLIGKCRCHPGYMKSSYEIENFIQREEGFYRAIKHNGLSASKTIVHSLTPSEEGAYADMARIIRSGEDLAKCYFADNDHIAIGAARAIKEAGLRIPEDVSIIGFDDLPQCEFFNPQLTTVRVPKGYMGQIAADLLIRLIERNSPHSLVIKINTSLIERKSVSRSKIQETLGRDI